MRRKIRKISVGPDYKNAMHYQLGQTVCGDHEILSIEREENGEIHLLIGKDNNAFFWKGYTSTVPISIEYNIDF
jgi:hypothetical protein